MRRLLRLLDELQSDTREWGSTHVVPSFDATDGEWRLLARYDVAPPTEEWDIRLGEIISHCRAGLDNAIYEAASREYGSERQGPVNFASPSRKMNKIGTSAPRRR